MHADSRLLRSRLNFALSHGSFAPFQGSSICGAFRLRGGGLVLVFAGELYRIEYRLFGSAFGPKFIRFIGVHRLMLVRLGC